MIAVSFGGGTNSTAMLVGLQQRGIVPDVILFADTGGEKPGTYSHVQEMSAWCVEAGFPAITTVKKVDKNGDVLTLEDDCVNRGQLPSIAYGFKTCSMKYKSGPQDKFMNNHPPAKAVWKAGEKITKLIGYDAGEPHRAKDYDDDKYNVNYPLLEWDWDRAECVRQIEQAGINLPGKSSCFFCPSSREKEIRSLAATHPDLMTRAIAMESNAQLTSVKGLGRRFAWKDVIATDDMFPEHFIEQACGCYD